jgi:protein-disulfide isomerase
MKKTIIYILAILFSVSLNAQKKEEGAVKREINIYNPFKPSLPDVVKKSFLPDMTDTAKVRPDFKYDVRTYPFSPPYTVSPIKAASLLPDALPKLYNSYIKIGMGNFLSPLGELSITNQRSKKGNIGHQRKG